jgi:WXXGXW repeat (2 copies)
MLVRLLKVSAFVVVVSGVLWLCHTGLSQAPAPPAAPNDMPPVPQGLDVMTRGPVHEAFATPSGEPRATQPVAKKPPAALEEMAPDDKPEGDVVWITGYWAWDDDRSDFLWVSGCWRQRPRGKEWIAGYWREQGEQWQWVPGFWTDAAAQQAGSQQQGEVKQVAYYPEPPTPPQIAPPGEPPNAESFYVPGSYLWSSDHYVWRAGYWAHVQPGYVWVPAHYRWTPYGYVYIGGYWDFAVARRGMLYAPVVVDFAVVGPAYVYTPVYAVPHVVVMDAFFIRPAYCHYYFGDYYGPRYRDIGFESVVVYSRRSYDPIIVYQRYEYRDNPRWFDVQVNLVVARESGRAPLPPRTLVQQNVYIRNNVTIVNNRTIIAPAAHVAAAQGMRTERIDAARRAEFRQQAVTAQRAAITQRRESERPPSPGARPTAPRVAAMHVPSAGPTARSAAGPAAGAQNTAAKTAGPAANAHAPPAAAGAHAPPGGVAGPNTTHNAANQKGNGPPGTAAKQPPQRQPPPAHHTDSKDKEKQH